MVNNEIHPKIELTRNKKKNQTTKNVSNHTQTKITLSSLCKYMISRSKIVIVIYEEKNMTCSMLVCYSELNLN